MLSIFPRSPSIPTFPSIFLAHLFSLSAPLAPPLYPLSCLSLPLSPLTTVPALSLDNRIPYLAVCSAQPWQSCQFTCLDCCILYSVSKTHCNYNPCMSKCTWYMAMSEQHPYHNFPKCFILRGSIPNKLSFKACKSTHYLAQVTECLHVHGKCASKEKKLSE